MTRTKYLIIAGIAAFVLQIYGIHWLIEKRKEAVQQNIVSIVTPPAPLPPTDYLSPELVALAGTRSLIEILQGSTSPSANTMVAFCNPYGGTYLAIELRGISAISALRARRAVANIVFNRQQLANNKIIEFMPETVTLLAKPEQPNIFVGVTPLNLGGVDDIRASVTEGSNTIASFGFNKLYIAERGRRIASNLGTCNGNSPNQR